ncbi:MAG: tail fiber domain-containing protein [Verrucomicrobiae bacterium]|nr:tail fiber domain-containing protein [Verrucomicrobiae bacterium]
MDGAEKDDAATVQARAAAGQGPRNGIASDRRLKHTIKQIGSMPNGLPVYSFKFEWEDRVRVGLVAQDLLERPEHRKAVLTMSNGLLGIDYASLGLRMATEIEWMAHGYEALKADYFSPETLAEEQLPKLNNRSNGH